ncbi:MAG: YaiI/YqxD family protein [Alphaproteobacteria bacterium]|nr:YaiI/YqxD family protein [Alphaproteobacteria bacterium]
MPIEILVDADACPVKAEVYRVAERYGLKVFVVSGALVAIPQSPMIERVIVGDGFDAADDWIAGRAGPRSIVVTADIPLASRALAAGAVAIGPTGKPFTKDSIGMAMATRELMQQLRAMGEVTGGPKPMASKDKSRFLSALDEAVNRLRRAI